MNQPWMVSLGVSLTSTCPIFTHLSNRLNTIDGDLSIKRIFDLCVFISFLMREQIEEIYVSSSFIIQSIAYTYLGNLPISSNSWLRRRRKKPETEGESEKRKNTVAVRLSRCSSPWLWLIIRECRQWSVGGDCEQGRKDLLRYTSFLLNGNMKRKSLLIMSTQGKKKKKKH